MSKRLTKTTTRRNNAAMQADFNHGLKLIFPGLAAAMVAFFMIINWIAAPAGPVFASDSRESASLVEPAGGEQPSSSSKMDTVTSLEACSIGLRYPDAIRQWCGLIEGAATKYGVEPDLLAAVMLQESGGDPQAYSSSGAVGLLQVMPRDGIAAGFMCQNGPCFANRPSMDELFDPAFNVDYGARMLAGLIQRTGSVRDGLLAYGPMDVGYYYADLVLTILKNYR